MAYTDGYNASTPAIVSAGSTIRVSTSGDWIPDIYERHYEYNVPVDLDYWREDAMLIHPDHANRIRQFDAFEQLYNGEYWRFGNYQVKLNYHEVVADFMSDLLLGFPPEFNGADALSTRFLSTLVKSTRYVIIDMIRFGTGIYQVLPGRVGPQVVSRSPRLFYPANESTAVLVNPTEGLIEVYFSSDDGAYYLELYENNHNAKLGKLVDQVDLTVGSVSDWNALYERFTGRVGQIVSVARGSDDDFGKSLYPAITNLAFENSRGLTDNRDTLIEHLKPLLLWMPNPNKMGEGGVRDDKFDLRFDARGQFLQRLRQSPSVFTPDGIIDGKYITWTPNLQASENHNEEIEKKLYMATNIARELYGTGTQTQPATGVSLDRQYLRSAIYSRANQTVVIEPLQLLLGVASCYDDGIATEAFIDGTEIVWPLVFDRIEETDDVVIDEGSVETQTDEFEEDFDVVPASRYR